jgi:pimeloyl-ACP methyl ester carboxylesterase
MLEVRSTVTSGDGVTIAVHDLGGRGPDLLLAHATGFHGHTWLTVVEHLRDRFRCVVFDLRGHGDSGTAAHGSFDWHAMADDALATVDGLGLWQPFGVGHSCGAALLLLAEEERPGTFASLYCFEPIVAPVDNPPPAGVDNPMPERARRRREVFASRDAAYEHFAQRSVFSAFDPRSLHAYVDHGFADMDDGSVRLKCRAEHEARVYEQGLSHRAYRHLHRVRCPVTLACGERTDTVGPARLEPLATRLSDVRLDVVAGLGHLGPMEDPEAVATSIAVAFDGG